MTLGGKSVGRDHDPQLDPTNGGNAADVRFWNDDPKIPAGPTEADPEILPEQYLLMLDPGETVAKRYEVVDRLGMGPRGAVFRVTDRNTDRELALKVMLPSCIDGATALSRFNEGLTAAQQIDSEHVVRVHDFGHDGFLDLHYVVMDLVNGESLFQLLKSRGGSLTSVEAIEIAVEIAKALEAIHERDAHRHLTPQNVMIDGNGRVRLLETGLGGVHAHADRDAPLRDYYRPSESSADRIGADLYALGVILYEMLTGVMPVGNALPPSDIDRSISKTVDRVALKCLALDPEKGFPSAADARRALEACLKKQRGGISTTAMAVAGIALVVGASVIGLRFVPKIVAEEQRRNAALAPPREPVVPLQSDNDSSADRSLAGVQPGLLAPPVNETAPESVTPVATASETNNDAQPETVAAAEVEPQTPDTDSTQTPNTEPESTSAGEVANDPANENHVPPARQEVGAIEIVDEPAIEPKPDPNPADSSNSDELEPKTPEEQPVAVENTDPAPAPEPQCPTAAEVDGARESMEAAKAEADELASAEYDAKLYAQAEEAETAARNADDPAVAIGHFTLAESLYRNAAVVAEAEMAREAEEARIEAARLEAERKEAERREAEMREAARRAAEQERREAQEAEAQKALAESFEFQEPAIASPQTQDNVISSVGAITITDPPAANSPSSTEGGQMIAPNEISAPTPRTPAVAAPFEPVFAPVQPQTRTAANQPPSAPMENLSGVWRIDLTMPDGKVKNQEVSIIQIKDDLIFDLTYPVGSGVSYPFRGTFRDGRLSARCTSPPGALGNLEITGTLRAGLIDGQLAQIVDREAVDAGFVPELDTIYAMERLRDLPPGAYSIPKAERSSDDRRSPRRRSSSRN